MARFGFRAAVVWAAVLLAALLAWSPVDLVLADGCHRDAGWTQLPPPEEATGPPGGSRLGALAVAAAWESPTVLYVGSRTGLFRTQDCGQSWERLKVQALHGQPEAAVERTTTAVSTDRRGVVYASGSREPVRVSRDRGQTWEASRIAAAWSLSASPAADGVIYAGIEGPYLPRTVGVARSEDGGINWEMGRGLNFAVVAADPFDPMAVFAASGMVPGIGRSSDGGKTFESLMKFDWGVGALAISPDGSHFWASVGKGALYLSRDLGHDWERVPRTPYQGSLRSLSASPHDPRVLFAVTDSGDLWAYREAKRDSRDADDFPIPDGRFYTQTSSSASIGYAVTDENGIPFYSAFRSLPLQTIGYPISQRFTCRGFTTQLFEKVGLQWQPGGGVFYLNLLDDLHDAGLDDWLETPLDIPAPADSSPDAGLSWDQVVARHLALLDRDPLLKAAYLGEPRWMELYGLPVGYREYTRYNVARGQRAAVRRWKVGMPSGMIGSRTVEWGVDLVREASLFPPEVFQSQPPPP